MTPAHPHPTRSAPQPSSQLRVGRRPPLDAVDASSSVTTVLDPSHADRRHRRGAGWWRWLALPVVAVALGACSNGDPAISPTPGGTRAPSPDATVPAPNGTNMGAPPINAGTAP